MVFDLNYRKLRLEKEQENVPIPTYLGGMPVDALDVRPVAAEDAFLGASEEVVDADGAVVRARGEFGVGGAERYAPHRLLVRLGEEKKSITVRMRLSPFQ